ncbi:transcriptional regulator with XRE-family HTH domain [Kineothrix alysoides]|uniref:Transcriptional regulator with XRE-family HTH domain n=1 Tax=Kineothrix alysoides TaxID=1469948 RepID=A0A4R1R4X7_9FIRM|nr:helix-turn-helix transcriptional regulator [Kineothrix alysoides]TCL60544.1 transcriptional regulator with XRE-family HTH domain [Kineothrix alysoides]
MTTVNFVLIGKRIKEIRCGQRITQAMLAEMTELSISYISHIETAYKQASLESLIRISDSLGVTVDELLNGNQLYNPTEYQTDIDLLMADCSKYERRFIFEIISATKISLRNIGCVIHENPNRHKKN